MGVACGKPAGTSQGRQDHDGWVCCAHAGAGDHPKAGKPMTQMDGPGDDSDGRRSKTPLQGGDKMLAANR